MTKEERIHLLQELKQALAIGITVMCQIKKDFPNTWRKLKSIDDSDINNGILLNFENESNPSMDIQVYLGEITKHKLMQPTGIL